MILGDSPREYRSPKHKLVRFFEKSRNRWRERCKEAKARLKVEKTHVRRLETQRDRWKERARELEAMLKSGEVRSAEAMQQDRFKRKQDPVERPS